MEIGPNQFVMPHIAGKRESRPHESPTPPQRRRHTRRKFARARRTP